MCLPGIADAALYGTSNLTTQLFYQRGVPWAGTRSRNSDRCLEFLGLKTWTKGRGQDLNIWRTRWNFDKFQTFSFHKFKSDKYISSISIISYVPPLKFKIDIQNIHTSKEIHVLNHHGYMVGIHFWGGVIALRCSLESTYPYPSKPFQVAQRSFLVFFAAWIPPPCLRFPPWVSANQAGRARQEKVNPGALRLRFCSGV